VLEHPVKTDSTVLTIFVLGLRDGASDTDEARLAEQKSSNHFIDEFELLLIEC
jgi:hypothetical protein